LARFREVSQGKEQGQEQQTHFCHKRAEMGHRAKPTTKATMGMPAGMPAFSMGEGMNEEKSADQKNPLEECATQLNSAAQAIERVIGKLEAQYEALNQKIDHIIATVEKTAAQESDDSGVKVSAQAEHVEKLEKENRDLRQRVGRKTLVPVVSALLAKSGVGEGVQVESGTLDKALGTLTVEQRIAVKAELARAGMIA
jgi:hypothetical protein